MSILNQRIINYHETFCQNLEISHNENNPWTREDTKTAGLIYDLHKNCKNSFVLSDVLRMNEKNARKRKKKACVNDESFVNVFWQIGLLILTKKIKVIKKYESIENLYFKIIDKFTQSQYIHSVYYFQQLFDPSILVLSDKDRNGLLQLMVDISTPDEETKYLKILEYCGNIINDHFVKRDTYKISDQDQDKDKDKVEVKEERQEEKDSVSVSTPGVSDVGIDIVGKSVFITKDSKQLTGAMIDSKLANNEENIEYLCGQSATVKNTNKENNTLQIELDKSKDTLWIPTSACDFIESTKAAQTQETQKTQETQE